VGLARYWISGGGYTNDDIFGGGVLIPGRVTLVGWAAFSTGKGLTEQGLKGATLMVRSSQATERSTSSSAISKRPKSTDSSDQTQGRSGMSTLELRNLYVGLSSQSLSPGKIIGSTYLTLGPTHWSLIP
jgi:hypothetical protein